MMQEQLLNSTITFIGAGNMATSMASGLIASGVAPVSITMTDNHPAQLTKLATELAVHTSDDNAKAAQSASIIVIAVKPDIVSRVCQEIGPVLNSQPLIISVAAGVREDDISRWLTKSVPIVRCIPNTPALMNYGAAAMHANAHCSSEHKEIAESLLGAIGVAAWVPDENLIDVATALSGSGPAYFFYMIETMTEAAISMGLPADVAENLAIETAYGAASMARSRHHSPGRLRGNVTSKGGTTAAALASFKEDKFSAMMLRAMEAARARAEALANEYGAQS